MSKPQNNEPPIQELLLSFLFPEVLITYRVDDYTLITDRSNVSLDRKEWEELRSRVDAFFATNPDAAIAQEKQDFVNRHYQPGSEERAAPKPRKKRPGYIYLLRGIGTGWYKIGRSKQPELRQKDIGLSTPFPCELVHLHPVSDMTRAEVYWHDLFADKRTGGEWFALSQDDVATFIKGAQL